MNNKIIFLSFLMIALLFSILGNWNQYLQIKDLEEKVRKLSQQDRVTEVAEEFLSLIIKPKLTEQEENRIRAISTKKAQKELFAPKESIGNHNTFEDVKQNLHIQNTYIKRINLEKVQVFIKYRLNYQMDSDKMFFYEQEMSMILIEEGTMWKVDEYNLELSKSSNDPLEEGIG